MALPKEAPHFEAPKIVLQTVDFLPHAVEISTLRRYPRGVDLDIDIASLPLDQAGLRYEEQCFERLVLGLIRNEVAIGPRLLNEALRNGECGQYARPDAMRFVVKGGQLELIELDEFKRKRRNSWIVLKEKIDAMPGLLDLFRTDQDLFPRLLREASGGQLDIGPILIKPNSQIILRVVTPHDHGQDRPILPFPAIYEQVAPLD